MDEIDELLEQAGRLHSAPSIAIKIVEITSIPDFAIKDVVRCLEHDPALAGSILRLVNSAHFGLGRQVSSIQQAVAFLGRRSLRLAVISFGIVQHLTRDMPKQLYDLYWRQSLTMASAARLCAQRIRTDADEAFTVGLMADLGMLLFAQVHGMEYVKLAMAATNSEDLISSERERFGYDHAAVTARLLDRWHLPDEIVQAAHGHHRLHDQPSLLSQVACVANLFAEALWTPESPHMQLLKEMLADEFDCGVDDLLDLALACRSAVIESTEIFQVQLVGDIDIEAVQLEARRLFEDVALEAAVDLDSVESMAEGSHLSPFC